MLENTYAYIPGKNWKLSLAELTSFLEMKNREFKIIEFPKAFFIATVSNPFPSDIASMGGMLKVSKVIETIETRTLTNVYLKKEKQAKARAIADLSSKSIIGEMYLTKPTKLVFGVSIYSSERPLCNISRSIHRSIGSAIKHELLLLGKKSRFMGFPERRKLPQLTHVEVLKQSLVENQAEVMLCIGRKQSWISKTIAVHNPFEFQKRDICRPVQRTMFAIPPRLARIMINLASCGPGKTLVDPFCGVGTILQEALLTHAKVIGLDRDQWCVNASRANLIWLTKEYSLRNIDCRILQGDARHLASSLSNEIECIVTEPDLGPALRQLPTTQYATKIIEKLRPLYSDFLGQAYAVLKKGGRLVLVTPYVKTRSGEPVMMNIEREVEDTGFIIHSPFRRCDFAKASNSLVELTETKFIVDVTEKHKIGRKIYVLQK